MASAVHFLLFISVFLVPLSSAQRSFRPDALVLPVGKDATTLQYVTQISQRTPLVPVSFVVDLGGQFLWADCENNYVSSTYRPVRCRSAQCSLARANACSGNDTCTVFPDNTVTNTATSGDVAQDIVYVRSTDGSNPGPVVSVPRFIYTCAPTFLLEGLASGAQGMAGLGRSRIALPSQFASAFSFRRKFAICLTSSPRSDGGVIFLGDGPYNFLPNIDASRSLTFTPLFINPVSTAGAFVQGQPSDEYFIGVRSINISNRAVPLNSSLLSIDRQGYGGTKISTVNPYTVMESSIYRAFTNAFVNEAAARNITRVAPVAPFEACFNRNTILSTRVGPAVPYIDLVLQSESVVWTMTGSNSMVDVSNDVLCLGFVDGGSNPRTSIVIGGYQFENMLLQFDLATSRLGFSPTLSLFRTTCSNFNSTSSP